MSWCAIVGWLYWFFTGFSLPVALAIVWGGSIAWEAVESYREQRLGQAGEQWPNRLIVDPVVNTLGALAGWGVARWWLG